MGLGKIFGGGKVNNDFATLSSGGLVGKSGGLTRTGERQAAVTGLAETFPAQADAIAGVRSSITPGLLRDSRLQAVEDARRRTTGNLRDNLARRRVLGSSFANDALARADAEFDRNRDRIGAEAAIQEANVQTQLIDREFKARAAQFATALQNMNFEAGLAANIVQGVNSIINQNARQSAAQGAANTSGFIGGMTGLALAPVTGGGSVAGNFASRLLN